MRVCVNFFCVALVLSFIGCHLRPDVTMSGSTVGIASGVVAITDADGEIIKAAGISNDRFEIKHPYLKRSGYYTLMLAPYQKPRKRFKIYLETADYNVKFSPDGGYPTIVTTSKIQNEISSFYGILERIRKEKRQRRAVLKADVNAKVNTTNPQEFNEALKKLADEDAAALSPGLVALQTFIKQQPDNHIAAQLMAEMPYEYSPDEYYKVYRQFNVYNKESSEGKKIEEKLLQVLKVKEGALAPQIAGLTPQGKTVDLKKLNTKLTLVEFWRAGNGISRTNHQKMVAAPFDQTGRNLSIISVSFDTKRDWWLTSVNDDKIKWTQVSDLKGDDSPNVKNWVITTIPTYYLLDKQGRIIEREIDFLSIKEKVDTYLATHPD